jgi:hypothetical protein
LPETRAISATPANFAGLTTPTALIWGARDSVTPLVQGERLHTLIRGSTLETIADVGYIPHIEDERSVAPCQSRPALISGAASSVGAMNWISSDLYRLQIGSEAAKSARWYADTQLNSKISSPLATRNALMNEPVANLANPFRLRTDILHEYFVSPARFKEFLAACREVIPPAKAEFLNVTLRYVAADPTAVMAYARTPRIAAVMSFSQEMSTDGEVDMPEMTERLIDRVVDLDGAFYLPYRLHARRDQVEKTYPDVERFVERKRFYDPKLLFAMRCGTSISREDLMNPRFAATWTSMSDDPTYLTTLEAILEGLRKAGMPEQ